MFGRRWPYAIIEQFTENRARGYGLLLGLDAGREKAERAEKADSRMESGNGPRQLRERHDHRTKTPALIAGPTITPLFTTQSRPQGGSFLI